MLEAPDNFIGEKMIAKGSQGDWGKWYWAASESQLACGVGVKSCPKGAFVDENGLTAVEVKYCDTYDWSKQSWSGKDRDHPYYGYWNVKMCPENMYIVAMEMKVQDPVIGKGVSVKVPNSKFGWGDDTGANRIRFKCRDLFRTRQS